MSILVNYTGSDGLEEAKRQEIISKILPVKTFVETDVEPALEAKMYPTLIRAIRKELEIYRDYPKRTEKEPVKEVIDFNPQHPSKCFMGKGFKANSHIVDVELRNYRNAVGKINHPIWGNVTLLEIWAGDHFTDHPKMVSQAFKYGLGLVKHPPVIKIFINPLFQNKGTGTMLTTAEERKAQEELSLLYAKARIFGVKESFPKRTNRPPKTKRT